MPTVLPTVHPNFWMQHPNLHLRLLGRDPTASTAIAAAARRGSTLFRVDSRIQGDTSVDDYAQIDPSLPLARDDASAADPLPNTSYAGFSPVQRRRFANWLAAPEMAGPVAFRQIYVAWLETALLEDAGRPRATRELSALLAAAGWRDDSRLAHAALLAGWLAQDAEMISRVMALGRLSPSQLATAAGWLAQLGGTLDAECGLALARGWNLHVPGLTDFHAESDSPLLELRITSLANTLGADPLAWALAACRAEGQAEQPDKKTGVWQPWPTAHRDIRLLLPQENLRPALEPRLVDLFASLPVARPAVPGPTDNGSDAGQPIPPAEWGMILEFGNSRSQHYDYVVHLARKQPGYRLLMDETRQLVHRVHFRRRQMRNFWRLWNYMESWSNVRVYVNGEAVQKIHVYPYSSVMR